MRAGKAPAVLTIKWEGDDIKWTTSSDGIGVIRGYTKDPKEVTLHVFGYTPGTHTIKAVACKDGSMTDFVTTTVTVGPDLPDPKPVDPVKPVDPPAPVPVDPFLKAIQDAYSVDPGADKATMVAKLVTLYRTAATPSDATTTGWLDDPSMKTFPDVKSKFSVARRLLGVPDTALVEVRKIANKELDALKVSQTAALTSGEKDRVRLAFFKIASALEGVK